ncbi:DUF4249 family protein [Arthrospiribacter ruber]|uniref:DUF4249 family protein n=1 Tax=Arthrospiribacter ruber TaxID=2487934 RepID=A0A951IVR7_9BACT|nr:DUF4249 family protein [Arthrospiribacter ruber]MBW3467788.1 DUF4249 family protein [Arthrospiribacter ruber]
MIRLIRNLLLSNPGKSVIKKFLYFFLLGFTSCIDPFKVDVDEGSSILSMEGYITTAPGPHQIKLTRTATYGDVFRDFIRPETQANVAIRENETGGVFDLPPANIRGNIVNISNPEETVLGHFFAAGVSSKQVTLEGAKLNLLQIQRAFNDDCRELPNSVESEDWFQD